MMNFISKANTSVNVGAIVMSHKVRLGNKYAFLLNKEVIGGVKSNLFTMPLKRDIRIDLDKKLEEEANTSTSSGDTIDQIVSDDQIKNIISAEIDNCPATTKKLMEDLVTFEEFLGFTGIITGDPLREIRRFIRFLIGNALKQKQNFNTVSKESILMCSILLAAEKFELDLEKILKYLNKNSQNRRLTKLSKIRKMKSFSLLSQMVQSYNSMPYSP